MSSGWIKLHRKIAGNWLWQDKPFSKGQAFIDLLLRANHKRSDVLFRDSLYQVEAGQFITSGLKLSAAWGWSRARTRHYLDVLQKGEVIQKKQDNRKLQITIVNWDTYQSEDATDKATDHTTGHTTDRQQSATNKNDKEVKKDKKGPLKAFFDLWASKGNLPAIQNFPRSRQDKFRRRMQERLFADHWREIIGKLSDSAFCTGTNDRGWRADVDWLLKNDANYVKVLEGKYDKTKADLDAEDPMRHVTHPATEEELVGLGL